MRGKTDWKNIEKGLQEQLKTEVGYSFYLAVGALIGAVVDILIGILSLALAKCCC